ncbi:MAG: phospholipid carrier-dependent glycosyltransferase [Planctomycetes bacterium]|nr:phospholipid carrier-dependent glycosyltransferase [Planctomycetota bacterium]
MDDSKDELRLGELPAISARVAPPESPDRLLGLFPKTAVGRVIAVVAILIVFGFLGVRLFTNIDSEAFHGDESWWLYYSRFFAHAVRFDFSNPEWTSDAAVDQPTVGKFVFGLSLGLGGVLAQAPTERWDFKKSAEWNVADGRMPNHDVLRAGRETSAIFALLAAAAVFTIACRISGIPAGLVAVLLLACNPLFLRCGRRAMPDTMLLFFVLVGVDLIVRFVRRLNAEEYARAAWLAAGVAVVGALATGTKLNGAIVFFLFIAAGLYVIVQGFFGHYVDRPRILLSVFAPPASVIAGFLLFALMNPIVLLHPIDGSWKMLSWRLQVAHAQATTDPDHIGEAGEPTIGERVSRVWTRTLYGERKPENHVTIGRWDIFPLDFMVFVFGMIALLASEAISWAVERLPSGRGVVILFIMATFLATLYWLRVDSPRFDRYYLFVIPSIAIASAFFPGEIIRLSARLPRPAA